MKQVYEPFRAPILVTDVNSAELIKHAANSFLSLKISYINAVSAICEASGADVEMVADGIGMDRRIGRNFLNAGLGYGGSCFPKDVKAFIAIARQLGTPFGPARRKSSGSMQASSPASSTKCASHSGCCATKRSRSGGSPSSPTR
jgi:nucleotide sugar dehydrogenase